MEEAIAQPTTPSLQLSSQGDSDWEMYLHLASFSRPAVAALFYQQQEQSSLPSKKRWAASFYYWNEIEKN